MREFYVFLAAAASVLAASDATSASTTVASTASIGRSLRVQGVAKYEEERTGADIKALVKKLLNIGATKSESFHISDDINDLKLVEAKVFQKEAKMVDELVAQGWTSEKMEKMLATPLFRKSISENDISEEGVNILRDLIKAKFPTEV